MPRSKSVQKRARGNEKRRVSNRANVSKYKTAMKKLEAAIEEKDTAKAKEMFEKGDLVKEV